jgi:RhtB (resistance to homoserine/threonine) family protein
MFGTTDLALFVVSGLLLNISPGPDTLYILGRTASQGPRSGAVAALGIGAGLMIHTVAAALGLSAILAASAMAFGIVKWIGAAYLVYLGVMLFFSRPAHHQRASEIPAATLRTVFYQGLLTNVLNPKVALFFLAFLPQFIEPATPDKTAAFLFLGLIFNFNGTLWNLFVAWSATRVSNRFRRSDRYTLWLNRTIGALLVYLGVRLAVSHVS